MRCLFSRIRKKSLVVEKALLLSFLLATDEVLARKLRHECFPVILATVVGEDPTGRLHKQAPANDVNLLRSRILRISLLRTSLLTRINTARSAG